MLSQTILKAVDFPSLALRVRLSLGERCVSIQDVGYWVPLVPKQSLGTRWRRCVSGRCLINNLKERPFPLTGAARPSLPWERGGKAKTGVKEHSFRRGEIC